MLCLVTPQTCPELPGPGAPLIPLTLSRAAFPVLSDFQKLTHLLKFHLDLMRPSLIAPISPPEIRYSFSKFMHDSLQTVTRFCRDVHVLSMI